MEPLRFFFKSKSRRNMPYHMRSIYGLNAILKLLRSGVIIEFASFLKVVVVQTPPRVPRIHYQPHNFESMFTFLTSLSIDYSSKFRFLSVDQLQRIKAYR